jgi:hypothetical protein
LDVAKRPVLVDQLPSDIALEGPDPVPGVWPSVPYPTPSEEKTVFPGEGKDQLENARMNRWGKKVNKTRQEKGDSSSLSPLVHVDNED